jgi:hypothetical protein
VKQLGLGFKGVMRPKTDDQKKVEKILMDEMRDNPDPKEQEYLERERERMRLQRMAKPWHKPLSD